MTLRLTPQLSSTMETPYSATRSRSIAACRSPTSTATPWPTAWEEPGIRSRMAPIVLAVPPPSAYTPETSRAETAAIFWTTPSAMVVLPFEVCNSEVPADARVLSCSDDLSELIELDGLL